MALAAPARWRRQGSPLRRREARAGLLFVAPWLLFLLIFTLYPVLATVYFSFTEYNVLQPPQWIGLANFEEMFVHDPAVPTAVLNSLYYAALSVPLRLVLAFALALVLNLGVRGISAYRVIFYLPALVPAVVATIVFLLLFNYETGPVNIFLNALGIPGPNWLRDPGWAKPAMIILSLWPLGIETLIFLAGLKEIPQDVNDAAAIDGANPWQRLTGITIPLLSPVILFNLVTGVIYSFQVFAQALVIGDTTGRPLESTLMYMVLIYRNAFRYFAMGYASAQALILFLVIAVISFVIFRTSRRWVYYEGGA